MGCPDVNSSGVTTHKLDVGLADESGEVILTLFGRMLASALRTWVSASLSSSSLTSPATRKSTVLLISNAGLKSAAARRISITSRTTVEVDPDIVEAGWLTRFAGNVESGVNPRWPEGGKRVILLVLWFFCSHIPIVPDLVLHVYSLG